MSSKPSAQFGNDATFPDIERYIALGCLRFDQPLAVPTTSSPNTSLWSELIHSDLPDEVKLILGNDVALLLDALWIRLFLHCPDAPSSPSINLIRVYLLPEDWGRRFIDRRSQKMRLKLRELLHRIDVSPQSWSGDHAEVNIRKFDPWAKAETSSLFYLFNKLQSPNPMPERIKNRYTRQAVEELLDSVSLLHPDDVENQPLSGLKTKLYPYQARSASIMVQRESAPELQLDPRLEIRHSPNGQTYMFGARDGSFLHEPQFYETNRGGILAETMGLGKTIICLAVILATQGHMPQIPPEYLSPPRVREHVGSLGDMAASILGRNAIPAQALLEQYEEYEGIDLSKLKHVLGRNIPHYEIPGEIPRMSRNTAVPLPRQLVMCRGTIVVVPRNLLHQWQAEIRKHVHKGSLKILIMDTILKRALKVSKAKTLQVDEEEMELKSDLPTTTELMKYDVILFTRNRFEQEFEAPTGFYERRSAKPVLHVCACPYIGLSNIRDCNCRENEGYRSPLKKLHWLRIIIDEGHSFSSSMSNAVQVAKQLKVERRWVVSGTPAKNLVGVEVDLSTLSESGSDSTALREQVLERMKEFSQDDESTKAAKALGLLAAHFLMVRPWSDSTSEGKLEWDEYIYRHEHQYRKTYSGFSNCFLRTLEGLVVKTRPEDVDRDIMLPPMKHRVVYLKPCWFDKMTANLFIQVLRANAITSERTGVDYLFDKSSIKPRHSLIRNLRQSNFTWTGFSLEDVAATLEATSKYMSKEDKKCSSEDAKLLLESTTAIAELMKSPRWIALSKAHEVGIAINNWPADSEEFFGMAYPEKPTMIGITQLLDGQSHVDRQILSQNPADGLDVVGQATKAKLAALAEAENESKENKEKTPVEPQLLKVGVPSSCVGGQPLTSRRTSTITANASPRKKLTAMPNKAAETSENTERVEVPPTSVDFTSPTRPKKRKLTAESEKAELPDASPLRNTRIIGTTSAKLTYLMEMVIKHQADEKIIIFYDGDNAAFYIAQCLEFLHVNHRIYARTLDNTKRSEYVALFNEDSDIRVLLIDVACGALGLNLNAASVVLIVNPINRPSIEAQAIKRAHRIGQTKEVLVETLVLEGTIEEAIFKQAKKMSRYVF
jgi:SNF2 family DNA or RNA helicase